MRAHELNRTLPIDPCGVVSGVQGIPKLNQILLKLYPCGVDPYVVAKGVQVIPKIKSPIY